jgi:hypothetical protein
MPRCFAPTSSRSWADIAPAGYGGDGQPGCSQSDRDAADAGTTRRLLRYLPPYSPDLSPTEPCWSKLNTGLRTAKTRTRAGLEAAIAQALMTITAVDAPGWFQHCGYILQ